MAFADSYIRKHCLFPSLISKNPDKDLNIIIVIPCYNEPDIEKSLLSLSNCSKTKKAVEVVIVINSSEESASNILEQNKLTEKILQKKLPDLSNEWLKFHVVHKSKLRAKHAGAGFARKIGMDEAIRRFNFANNPNGIIVSFDADSLCDTNFLVSVEDFYTKYPKAIGSAVYFEHPTSGTEFSNNIYSAITQYELYLRYYNQALRHTVYPFAFHTVGSCFNVKASAYASQGGMNKKQAGEDFYFLQKIIPNGVFGEINSTCVYPSPRPSDRVPFGTGPIINKLLTDQNGLQTYSLQSFLDLRKLFTEIEKLFKADKESIEKLIIRQSEAIRQFLLQIEFKKNIDEINKNSSTSVNFNKRFFKWFNAFKILKYLNFTQSNFYKDEEIETVAIKLLKELNIMVKPKITSSELLIIFREIERKNPVIK